MSIRDTLATVIARAEAANIGYDRSQRRSWYDDATHSITPGASEADCSALSAGCWRLAGIPINADAWTGSIVNDAKKVNAGVIDVSGRSIDKIQSTAKCGDILRGEGHAVIFDKNGMILSAEGDENGHSSGGKAGDQTGREVVVRRLYERSRGWSHLLTPPGADEQAVPMPWTHRVTTDALNVRVSAPVGGKLAQRVTTVNKEARLILTGGYAGDWVSVKFEGGSVGWVNNQYIDRIR